MARIEDIPQPTRDVVLGLACPELPGSPWVVPKPLSECRIAILTSAALIERVGNAISRRHRRVPHTALVASAR